MTDETPRHETGHDMAGAFANEVRDARFAKSYGEAMSHFGGRDGADAKERLMAWRQVKAAPHRPQAEELPPEGFRGEGPRGG